MSTVKIFAGLVIALASVCGYADTSPVSVEPGFWGSGTYEVRDSSGRLKARIERDFWDSKSYRIKDEDGDTVGTIKPDFWSSGRQRSRDNARIRSRYD